MRAGEDITVKVTIARDGHLVEDGQVEVRFFSPGRDPRAGPPWHAAVCSYDLRSRRWKATVPTADWEPGVWTIAVDVAGQAAGGLIQRFPLAG
jgi:hypothetical protein